MIKSVTVTNYLGESLKMELTNPYDSGIAITDITGIGPGKADINVTELTSSDGSLYNSARLGTRNIVMTLRFMIAPDIETVRQKSYKYFPIKKELILTFETDNRSCYIAGYVESNEPVIFDENEYTQISIIIILLSTSCEVQVTTGAAESPLSIVLKSIRHVVLKVPFFLQTASLWNIRPMPEKRGKITA